MLRSRHVQLLRGPSQGLRLVRASKLSGTVIQLVTRDTSESRKRPGADSGGFA